VLLYALPLLAIGLLLAPLVWLASVLGRYLKGLLPNKARNFVLIGSLLLWAGLWVLTYYAPAFKQLTPTQKDNAGLLCALLTFCYPVPLLLLVVLIKRNGYVIFTSLLFLLSKLPGNK
jgi:hypothetical protein